MSRYYDEMIERMQFLSSVSDKLRAVCDQKGVSIVDTMYGVSVDILDLKSLKKAREVVKSVFPGWRDKLDSIWNPCSDILIVRWEDERYPEVGIRMDTKVAKFPKELLREEGCFIEKIESKEVKYKVTCRRKQ